MTSCCLSRQRETSCELLQVCGVAIGPVAVHLCVTVYHLTLDLVFGRPLVKE